MAWPKGPRVHKYSAGQTVRFHDEVTGRWHVTKIVRLGKERGQNYYVVEYGYGRIALPSQIKAVTKTNPSHKRRKLHTGPRGGKYIIRHGRKVYR